MTKAAAIHTFFSSFGLDAYSIAEVPTDVMLPYLTYELSVGAFDDGEVNIPVNLWFYTTSEAVPNAKVQEISERIGYGGITVSCDGGKIWIKRGTPFAQSIKEENGLKRRLINIDVEYLTLN